MNRPSLFVGVLIVTLFSLVCMVYAWLPGVYQVLVSRFHPPLNSQHPHIMQVVVFGILNTLAALVNRATLIRRTT
jgi:uncharacterized membrane protein (DUF106 family)